MKVKVEIDGKIMADMESDLCFFRMTDKNNPGMISAGIKGAATSGEICAQLAGTVVGLLKSLEPDIAKQKLLLAFVVAGILEEVEDDFDDTEAMENKIKEYLN